MIVRDVNEPSSMPTSIPSGGEPSPNPTGIPTIDQTTYTPTVEPTPAPSEPPTSTLNSGSTDSEPVDNTGLIIVITIPIVIIFAYAAYCGFVKYNSYLHRVAPSEVTEQNIKNIKRIVPM